MGKVRGDMADVLPGDIQECPVIPYFTQYAINILYLKMDRES